MMTRAPPLLPREPMSTSTLHRSATTLDNRSELRVRGQSGLQGPILFIPKQAVIYLVNVAVFTNSIQLH